MKLIGKILVFLIVFIVFTMFSLFILNEIFSSYCDETEEVPFRYESSFWGTKKVETIPSNSDGIMQSCKKYYQPKLFDIAKNLEYIINKDLESARNKKQQWGIK